MANDFSFFIYDYESFGINPANDRPAQFAGIRTDADSISLVSLLCCIASKPMIICPPRKPDNGHRNYTTRM